MLRKKFPEEVLAESDNFEFSNEVFEEREEITGITIDGAGSKDLDDAIFVQKLEDGYRISVSIADVAFSVRHESPLFEEALLRGATIYKRRYTVPMLPYQLSEGKLSLVQNSPRPTITFDMVLNTKFEVANINIKETFIKNRRRMSYDEVDRIIGNKPDDPDHVFLVECFNLAQILLRKRQEQGALAVYDMANKIFTNEEGHLITLNDTEHKGNLIVQELMILTNQATARFLAKQGVPILFRNHTVQRYTPTHREIMSQYNAALVNPQLLESLIQRVALWLNRAVYSPVLEGHFGLNEIAYTHVTSPIRRISDLINHYIIRAFINEQPLPYTHDDLVTLSKIVNERLYSQREETSQYFKKMAYAEAHKEAKESSVEYLASMEISQFKPIIKQSCRDDLMNDEFEKALILRFTHNKMDVIQLYYIIFESVGKSEVWDRIRDKALLYVLQSIGFSIQLLNLELQKGNLRSYDIEVKEKLAGFLARVVAVTSDGIMSTPSYILDNTKKRARHVASNDFLEHYLAGTLIPAHETKFPKKIGNTVSSPKKDKDIVYENYVGRLGEICAENHWQTPQYSYQKIGPSHQPTITCECSVNAIQDIVKASGIANSKKTAKHVSARNILLKIDEMDLENMTPSESDKECMPTEENYVGILNEVCQRLEWSSPKYEFQQFGSLHQPSFVCTLRLHDSRKLREISGTGTSKKASKQMAAEKMYRLVSG
ncbi:MAG: hypothetical protein B6242_02130 [Anaerolineaceae bacterium 4572_78]|nr:MAG: hypothetical protein B6242_02130 [Anaerolineaceae bacterium 4572_78]